MSAFRPIKTRLRSVRVRSPQLDNVSVPVHVHDEGLFASRTKSTA